MYVTLDIILFENPLLTSRPLLGTPREPKLKLYFIAEHGSCFRVNTPILTIFPKVLASTIIPSLLLNSFPASILLRSENKKRTAGDKIHLIHGIHGIDFRYQSEPTYLESVLKVIAPYSVAYKSSLKTFLRKQ